MGEYTGCFTFAWCDPHGVVDTLASQQWAPFQSLARDVCLWKWDVKEPLEVGHEARFLFLFDAFELVCPVSGTFSRFMMFNLV